MTPALIPATNSPRCKAPYYYGKACVSTDHQTAHSGSQRGKQPQRYPSPTSDAKAAHRAKNPRKGGGSAPLFQRVEVGHLHGHAGVAIAQYRRGQRFDLQQILV